MIERVMDESVYVGGNEAQAYFFSKLELHDKNKFIEKRCNALELSHVQTKPHHRLEFHVFARIKCLDVSNERPLECLSNQIELIRNSNVDASYKRRIFKEDFCTPKYGRWAYKHPNRLKKIHRLANQPNFRRWQPSQIRPRCVAV